jgi:hypothetical protein
MPTERLKELREAMPYRAFVVRLADGRRIRVTHPEAMARRDNSRTVLILDSRDHAHYVDLLDVKELVIPESPRSRKNGNGKH